MPTASQIAAAIAARIQGLPESGPRRLIAIAGAPGSGKSTVAKKLCEQLNAEGLRTGLVAMDGFHLDNAILKERGLLARKGAPETFDLDGFDNLLARLSTGKSVIAPRFDRDLDASIGSAVVIDEATSLVVVEGNYLLLESPGWRDLRKHWTYSVFLSASVEELAKRLQARWLGHGLDADEASRKVGENDLPNARLVQNLSTAADLTLDC